MFGFLGHINSGFALWDRYKKWRNSEPTLTNTGQRFIRLFEAHGLARAQIPRFFGHNLTIHQVEDETLSEGQFGIESAMTLWLEYQQQGLMGSGFGSHKHEFEKFKNNGFK
jgi:hypothetical protein